MHLLRYSSHEKRTFVSIGCMKLLLLMLQLLLFCVVIPATGSFAKGPSFTEISVEATDQETLIAPQPPQTV